MSVKHKPTIAAYISHHAGITHGLENIREFVDSMPAPDDNGELPTVDYEYTADVARIFGLIGQIIAITDKMSG